MHTTTQLAADVIRAGTAQARQAHAALFERILGRVSRYFSRLVRDGQEAAECVQQTLVLLEESLQAASYDPRYSFNGWVFLKAHTVFAQWCRQREKQPGGLPEVEIPDSQPDPLEATSRRLDAETVLSAVRDRLGQEPYEAFVLYYEGGLTQQEIAHTLGRDRKTIAGRLSQAHRLIDQLLEKK